MIKLGERESKRLVVKDKFNLKRLKKGGEEREFLSFFFSFLSATLVTWVTIVEPIKCILQVYVGKRAMSKRKGPRYLEVDI